MHFHLPKPLHGWRAFAGEVGIIVIGVLIALTAEQLVADWHWHREASNFRGAVEHEIGRDLGIGMMNMKQRACVGRRLDELERFLAASTSGRRLTLQRPIERPSTFSSYYSVWDQKGADVTEHLPLELRLRYGEIYDELHNQDVVRLSERDVWRSLTRFDQPEPLDHADRMLMRELLTRARQLDDAERNNYGYIAGLSRPLGVRPIFDPALVRLNSQESSFCRPLLAPK